MTGGATAATSSRRWRARSGIKLALLPGECRDEDLRLIECSTLPRDELDALLGYFREGGPENMTALVRRLAALAGREAQPCEAVEVPKAGFYDPVAKGAVALSLPLASGNGLTAPVIPILFYRSMLLAADVAPIDALCGGAARQGHATGADLRRQPEGSLPPPLSSSRRYAT